MGNFIMTRNIFIHYAPSSYFVGMIPADQMEYKHANCKQSRCNCEKFYAIQKFNGFHTMGYPHAILISCIVARFAAGSIPGHFSPPRMALTQTGMSGETVGSA